MVSWLKTYIATHLFYIALIVAGVIFVRVWITEHDARVQAEITVKQATTQIASLQTQIASVQQKATSDVAKVRTVVLKASTPSQVVAAIPSLTDLPLATRTIPGNPVDVEVAAQPLMQLAGDLKTSQIELGACQQTVTLKDQQLTAKDVEIKALTKKPNFLHRLGNVAKAVGVGIGIGLLISGHL